MQNILLCFSVVEKVKKRWNNIKGTFLDNNRKVRESKRSGSSTEDIFKPRWPLYTRLQFLKKTISSAQSVSNFPPPVRVTHQPSSFQLRCEEDCQNFDNTDQSSHIPFQQTPNDINEIGTFYFDETSKRLTLIPQNTEVCNQSIQNFSDSSEQDIASSQASSMSQCSLSTTQFASNLMSNTSASASVTSGTKLAKDEMLYTKRGASKKQKSGFVMEEAVEAIKGIASQPIILPPYTNRPAQDVIDNFTAYIADKLRDMSPRRRKFCEEEIMKIVFGAVKTDI
ncbi:uncharacterized protein LOC116847518 [Odontomachus brunneus]|uniref:uncharacterized protein LOC116847518 n=1 Tax=Odontomachus brunneus TaxID=486640 RepID=UPI0013F28894|nr:uncharacterized protein LOC116847518 [Odontomachus brunneus]